ncbi:hypothetical protein CFRS1_v011658 [Colletotrichum fructicola]|nr:hypothetical protein CFRS1_v011658 [Colletotrichum fructicola]
MNTNSNCMSAHHTTFTITLSPVNLNLCPVPKKPDKCEYSTTANMIPHHVPADLPTPSNVRRAAHGPLGY